MSPLRSLGNPDISPFDDVFAATGKRYNHKYLVPLDPWYGDRAVFMGGYNPNTDTMDYRNITSAGNAADFGDLNHDTRAVAPASGDGRGLAMGGRSSVPGPDTSVDYITIGTTGNATDFGDTTAQGGYAAGASNGTRALSGGGLSPSVNLNKIEYFTIATAGNGTDLADLTVARYGLAACSSGYRAVFGGGYNNQNVIDYKNFETANATDFGDLTVARGYIGAAQSTPAGRGFWSGGGSPSGNLVIDYVTIDTAGNATDFGDPPSGQGNSTSATSNATRGVMGGGGSSDNQISYITIANTGNASDFGDLTVGRGYIGATSGD